MARTSSKPAPAADLDLGELEARHEKHNDRRAVLSRELADLRERRDSGEQVAREIRHVERQLDDLEQEVLELAPALQDARDAQNERIQRAANIDRAKREIAVLEDVAAFQEAVQRAAEKHLADHLTPRGLRGASGLSRYAKLGRDFLHGPLHLNGSQMNAAGQVRLKLDRARARLDELLEDAT